jgi:RNA polymerase-binding transcription factor DksA
LRLTGFLKAQRQRLLDLRDELVDLMEGVARDSLRVASEGAESAFGMHTADAGADAYDRELALRMLSKEQDGLNEIDEALERIELGTYGICEISGNKINKERLEALPFAKLTRECQEIVEQSQYRGADRSTLREMFGANEASLEVRA